MNLLNTNDSSKQPVEWFSSGKTSLELNTKLLSGYRYLDITNFAQIAGWKMQTLGNTLVISTPTTKVIDIVADKQPTGERLIVNLDRPTFWQVGQDPSVSKPNEGNTVNLNNPESVTSLNQDLTIILDGVADSRLIQRYSLPVTGSLIQKLETVNNQTIIHLSVPKSQSLKITTLPHPHRLIIDVNSNTDNIVQRDIAWASGIYWRQRLVNLGTNSFPVFWLEINPRIWGLKIKPIWANSQTLAGTAPLIQTAQRYSVVAAINGGFFNRNNKFPLGAIRRDSQWVSGQF